MLPVWFPGVATEAAPGLAMGADAAEELGIVDRSRLPLADVGSRAHLTLPPRSVELRRISPVLPAAVRNPSAGRVLFDVAAPRGTTGACFVDPDPAARAAVESALVGWFGSAQPASVSPFLDDEPSGRLPEAELAARTSRWAWSAAVQVISALLAMLWYGRRDEFALYRLLGLRRRSIAVLLATEALLTAAVPALVGGSIALVTCQAALAAATRSDGGVPALAPLVAGDAASFLAALALVPLVGLAVVGWRSTFEVLKGS